MNIKPRIHARSFLCHWVAPLALLGCGAWFVHSAGTRERPERKPARGRNSVPVKVVRAEPHTGTLQIKTSGVVIPYREVNLSTRVAGEVVFKSDSLSPGRTITQGELLLRIDDSDYKLEVARLEQEVERRDIELERLAIDIENARRLVKINREIVEVRRRESARMDQLKQRNATSASENDAAELALLTAVQQATTQENLIRGFDHQRKTLEMARKLEILQLERAKLDLQRTEIVAPFSGIVIANAIEQNATVTPGSLVATIEDTSRVEVRCSLRSEDLPFIHSDTSSTASAYELPPIPVSVRYVRGGQTFAWNGVLSRQDGLGLDQATRTLPVRIRVPHPTASSVVGPNRQSPDHSAEPLALVRGMFVSVHLQCQPKRPLAVIPESVLRPGKQIWLIENDHLAMESIRIARIDDGRAYVDMLDSPFRIETPIVSSPVPNARNGLPVAVEKPKRNARSQSATATDPTQAKPKDLSAMVSTTQRATVP